MAVAYISIVVGNIAILKSSVNCPAIPKKLAGLPGQAAHLFDYKSPARIEYPPEKAIIVPGITFICRVAE